MSYSSQFHMPGAYHLDPPNATGPPLSSSIFRTPGASSPSASSSVFNLAKSTGSLYSDPAPPQQQNQTATSPSPAAWNRRHRHSVGRAGGPETRESTPLQDGWSNMAVDDDDGTGSTNRYTLQGQIETPTANGHVADPMAMEDSFYSDIDYRRRLGSKRPFDEMDQAPLSLQQQLFQNQTKSVGIWGVNLDVGTPNKGAGGWSRFAVTTIGGVVGKMWQFCTAGAFKGFRAGGGIEYGSSPNAHGSSNGDLSQTQAQAGSGVDGPVPTLRSSESGTGGRVWCNEHDVPTLQQDDGPVFNSSGPSALTSFPDPTMAFQVPPPDPIETTPTRHDSKRRKRAGEPGGRGGEELEHNWVVLPEVSSQGSPLIKSRRPASRASTSRLSLNHRSDHRPQAGTPRFASSTASSAGRRINIPVSRLSTGYNPAPAISRPSSRISSHAGGASLSHREPASFAAPRSPITTTTFTPVLNSPSRIPVPTTSPTRNGFSSSLGPNPFAANSRRPDSPSLVRPASRQSPTRTVLSPPHLFSGSSGIPGGSLRGTPSSPGHRRTRSSLSPRRKASMPAIGGASALAEDETVDASPRLDPEAKRLAARRAAEERNTDARMDAFSAQLRQMIREGKEALGTRVTVDIRDDDGGGGGRSGQWSDYDDDDI